MSKLESDTSPPDQSNYNGVDLGTKVTGMGRCETCLRTACRHSSNLYGCGSAHDWSANGVPNSVLITKPFVAAQIITALSQLLNAVPPAPQHSASRRRDVTPATALDRDFQIWPLGAEAGKPGRFRAFPWGCCFTITAEWPRNCRRLAE